MMPLWLGITLFFLGGFVGLFTAALACAAGRADELMERMESDARQGRQSPNGEFREGADW